jgi:hypothetical protein
MRPPLPGGDPGDLPIPVRGVSVRAAGSQTAQGANASRDINAPAFAFRVSHHVGSLSFIRISRLNTRPARAPVNASPWPLQTIAHDSGLAWLATPSPYDSSIHDTSPVFIGARDNRKRLGPYYETGTLTPM